MGETETQGDGSVGPQQSRANGPDCSRGEAMAEDSERIRNTQASSEALRKEIAEGADIATIKESQSTQRATKIAKYSAWIAALAAVASIVLSLYSAHLVGQQNSNAQQQELVSLVTDIEQGQQAATAPNGASAALIALGEAEEANSIIASLHSNVSSAEKYIVGIALEDGDDYQPALTLLTSAAKEGSDPRTAADAWRAAAAVLYTLDMNRQAESDMDLARGSYTGKYVTWVSRENNIAFTDLFDVPYQASIGQCSFAESKEWNKAAQLIQSYYYHYHHHYLLGGPNSKKVATNARQALLDTCKVAPGTLKANNILTLISP